MTAEARTPADVICAALEPALRNGLAAHRTAAILDALRAAGWGFVNDEAVQPETTKSVGEEALREALDTINVHDETSEYELRADGDYKPDEFEQLLLEDFGCGLIAKVEEALRAAIAVSQPPESPSARQGVIAEIIAERRRRVEVEGWTPEHDDTHTEGELADAAACYAAGVIPLAPVQGGSEFYVKLWPWSASGWKPGDRRRDLIKSIALGVAEIERMDCLSSAATAQNCAPAGQEGQ